MNTFSLIGLSTESNDTMNEDTPVGVASAVKEGIAPYVVDMTVEIEKLSSVEDTIVLGSFPPLSTPVITTTGNDPDKSSYANVTGKPSGKKLNIRTLFTPGVVANYVKNTWGKYGLVRFMFRSSIGLFSFQFSSMDRLDAMPENGTWFIKNNPLIPKKWHPDENLLKEDVNTVPVWLNSMVYLSSYTRVMIELRADVELKDNIIVAMPKIIREGHYICNVRLDYERKPPRPVPKKPTSSSSGNKKKGMEPTTEVSNSNPFEVLNSVNNDVELCTNGGGLLIWNFEELLTSGKATLVDEAGNLLKNVEFPDDYDSEDEVALVDNYMARSMGSKRVGHDLPQELQVICNNLDIRVRGRKKK
nr:hypothetical protein [Tanacetum cinerariifolium]